MNLKNFGIAFVMLSVLTACSDSVPTCGDSEVKDLVKEIAIDNLLQPQKTGYKGAISRGVEYIEQQERVLLEETAEKEKLSTQIEQIELFAKLNKEKHGTFKIDPKDFANILKSYGVDERSYNKYIVDGSYQNIRYSDVDRLLTQISNQVETFSTLSEFPKKYILNANAKLESDQTILKALNDGEFAIAFVRTTDVNETTGKNTCVAELQFTHEDISLKGDVHYTVQNTDDGSVYVEANLPSIF